MKVLNFLEHYSFIIFIFICLPKSIKALQFRPSLLNNTFGANEGTGVVISCIDNAAAPNSQLIWTSRNREITAPNMHVAIVAKSPPTSGLFVSSISRQDSGEYKCQSIDKTSKKAIETIVLRLVVYKNITFSSPSYVNISENDDARLDCVISSDADIKSTSFTWKSNGEIIDEKTDSRIKITETNNYSELRISKVTRNDTRVYDCEVYVVYALAFKIASQSITLTVEYKPEFAPNIPKNIWIPGKHATKYPAQTVNITCIVNAMPVAKIEWKKGKNGDIRSASEYIKEISEENLSTLIIKRPERRSPVEEINYTCVASNKYGTSRHEFSVKEGSPPNIPKLISFQSVGDKMQVVIEEGFTSPKLDYYKLVFGDTEVKFDAGKGSVDMFTRTNETYSISLPKALKGEQTFTLYAHNPIGWSQPSQDNSFVVYINYAMNLVNNSLLLFLMIVLLHVIH